MNALGALSPDRNRLDDGLRARAKRRARAHAARTGSGRVDPWWRVLALAAATFAQSALAVNAAGGTAPALPAPPSRPTMTGDWNGARSRLVEQGITFRGDYVSESFTVLDGGLRHGSAYTQQIRAGFDLDMGKLAGWTDTTFHFTVNDRRGVGISPDYVGNRLPIQEAYGGQYARLSELSVEHEFGSGSANLRVGYFAMGNDLGGIAAGCNFVNAAFCAHPLSMSANTNWYNYPNARWGAALRMRARDDLLLRTGVFQVNRTLGEQRNAFNPFAGSTRGVVLPLELEYTPGHHPADRWLPGSYKLGYIHDTARAARTPGPGFVESRQGYYLLASQTVWREAGGRRGVSLIGAYTANPRTAAEITRWSMLGMVRTGTFAGRSEDTLGVAVVRATLNPSLRTTHDARRTPTAVSRQKPARRPARPRSK